MTKLILNKIFSFFLLVAIQVVILNKIQFNYYINPYLYIVFIILLPLNIPGWILLISSFLLGFVIDAFSDTYGMHSAASVLIAFCRPWILKITYPKQDYDAAILPSLKYFGFRRFFSYSLIMVFIHHTTLFYIEVFNFYEIFHTFYKIILSSVFTMLLIILSQYLSYSQKK